MVIYVRLSITSAVIQSSDAIPLRKIWTRICSAICAKKGEFGKLPWIFSQRNSRKETSWNLLIKLQVIRELLPPSFLIIFHFLNFFFLTPFWKYVLLEEGAHWLICSEEMRKDICAVPDEYTTSKSPIKRTSEGRWQFRWEGEKVCVVFVNWTKTLNIS